MESFDIESSVNYYHRSDLNDVIQVLKTSDIRFGGILNAISKHWDIPVHSSEANSDFDPQNQGLGLGMIMKGQIHVTCMPLITLAPTGACAVKDDGIDEKKGQENFIVPELSGDLMVENSINLLDAASANHYMKIKNPFKTSEGSAETIEAVITGIQNCQKHRQDLPRSAEILVSNDSEVPGKSAVFGHLSSATNKTRDSSQVDSPTSYMNYYCFAQAASSVADELMPKSMEKLHMDSTKSVEEIISMQLMAISKKYTKFCWPNIPNINVHVQNENCGWCYSCKAPEDGRDCLLKMNDAGPVQEGSKNEVVDLQPKRNRKGHLVSVINHILCIEDRLRGLLLGPWLNPHFSKHWRKSVLKAPDVASVKKPLLTVRNLYFI